MLMTRQGAINEVAVAEPFRVASRVHHRMPRRLRRPVVFGDLGSHAGDSAPGRTLGSDWACPRRHGPVRPVVHRGARAPKRRRPNGATRAEAGWTVRLKDH